MDKASTSSQENPSRDKFPIGRYIFLSLIAGGVHAAASSIESGLTGVLSLLSFFLLAFILMRVRSAKQAALVGWAYAFVWLYGSVRWLYVSMHEYGGLPAILAMLAVILLCAGMALIYAIAAGLSRKASPQGTLCTISFAAAWMLAEMMRGWLFTGFPWAASGYAHTGGMLSSYAPWLGVYGVGGVAAFMGAAIALLVQYGLFTYASKNSAQVPEQKNKAPFTRVELGLVSALLVVSLVLTIPLKRDFTETAGTLQVALLQGNVPQDLKFDPVVARDSFGWYIHQLKEAKAKGAQLVVMPETAIPFFLHQIPDDTLEDIHEVFASGEVAALVGLPLLDDENRVTNSILGFEKELTYYRYDKYHLVPFGEFIPPGFQWFVDMMEIPLGNMSRGTPNAEPFAWKGQKIAPNICYEDLFGEEIAKRFQQPESAPTILVNASNIAWFGDTAALPQHLQIARMRALEFQRPMIRATNTGVTAIINHQGQVQDALPYYTQGMLLGEVEGRRGLTPYAWWASRWGLMPLWLLAGLALGIALFLRRKSNVYS